jgi:hypothetical protein
VAVAQTVLRLVPVARTCSSDRVQKSQSRTRSRRRALARTRATLLYYFVPVNVLVKFSVSFEASLAARIALVCWASSYRSSRGHAGALVGWDGCEVRAFVCPGVSRVCPGSPRCAFTDPAQRHTRLKRATNHTRIGCRVCRVNVHAPHRRVIETVSTIVSARRRRPQQKAPPCRHVRCSRPAAAAGG